MTNHITANFAAQNLTDSSKGSVGNRMDCAGEHMKNNATAMLKAAGVYGTLGAAGYVAVKNPKAWTKFANKVGFGAFKTAFKIAGKGNKAINKVVTKMLVSIAKNPKLAIVSTALTAAGVATASIIHNHAFKSGQIDQKYTDKANLQKSID